VKRIRHGCLGAALAATVLTVAGCASSPAPRLYVLTPLAEPGNPLPGDPAVGVGPVALAPHLDRPQIVRRRGNELFPAELDRWGEPLADGVARVLAEDLARLLASDKIWVYPWRPAVRPDFEVTVEVLRCDAGEDGDVVLAARFAIFGGGEAVLVRRFERREPAVAEDGGAIGPAAAVEALSRVLAELGREIAGALAGLVAG
jgi:uncharacterized lipoprotein YmbA